MERSARDEGRVADSRTESSTQPVADAPVPDSLLWEALPDLKLNIAQTAALCGISVRQLGYWTKQGYVTASGRGSRRLYGLDSLRRILAIRKSMGEGASLRQSLRTLEAPAAAPAGLAPRPSAGASGDSGDPAPAAGALAPPEAEVLTRGLLTLFEDNRQTRDNAAGLATKLGREEEDVRQVAEALCAAGILAKVHAAGDSIFLRAPEALP